MNKLMSPAGGPALCRAPDRRIGCKKNTVHRQVCIAGWPDREGATMTNHDISRRMPKAAPPAPRPRLGIRAAVRRGQPGKLYTACRRLCWAAGAEMADFCGFRAGNGGSIAKKHDV